MLAHLLPLALTPALALGPAPAPAPRAPASSSAREVASEIAWETSYAGAFKRAAAESRPIFVAVNMDGERANERMVDEVYQDRAIAELAARTVNLIASKDVHADKPLCPRFGSLSCQEHRYVEAAVRKELLVPDEQGSVVAPQHLFLAPDGSVILSVPYAVSEAELEWCFVAALESVDRSKAPELSERARRPARLILRGVYQPGENSVQPPTREQTLELIEDHRRGSASYEVAMAMLARIATADEPEAREYMLTVLKPSGGGRGRGGGEGQAWRPKLMRWIGVASPPSYWEVALEYLDSNEDEMRREAIVVLEQLGAPQALKPLLKEQRGEKDATIAKNLLRAIGATARDDKKARKLLLDAAADDRDALLRLNAIVALGALDREQHVDDFLRAALEDQDLDVRSAAAIAIALTRDEAWVETCRVTLEELRAPSDQPGAPGAAALARTVKTLEAALAVLEGERLSRLRPSLKRVTKEEIPRDRLFAGPGGAEDGL